eukprot:13818895-Alexandrium_andersonii.AAC.1
MFESSRAVPGHGNACPPRRKEQVKNVPRAVPRAVPGRPGPSRAVPGRPGPSRDGPGWPGT